MSSTDMQPTNQGGNDRPFGLAAIAGIDVVFGAGGILGGAAAFTVAPRVLAHAGASLTPQTLGMAHVLIPILATALLGLGAFSLLLGCGLWRGARWAWAVAIIAELAHGVGSLGALAAHGFTADKLIGLAVAAAVVYYLTRPGVRAFFDGADARA